MELSKQNQEPMTASMGSQALPSSNIRPTQTGYPAALYPPLSAGRGAQEMFCVGASVPASSYYIVPMSQQAAAQAGASRPEISHPLGAQSVSRVSLRPPQQVLNIQTSLPAVTGSQLSPSVAGKKSVASPKVQMMKSTLSTKRPAQKEQPSKPQPQPQQFESVRSKFRESLSTALVMDSYQQDKKQSAQNLQSDGSADQKGDEVQDIVMTTSKDASTTNSEADNGDVAKKCERDEKLGCACKDDVHGLTESEPENHRVIMHLDMKPHTIHLCSDFSGLGRESWDRHDFLRVLHLMHSLCMGMLTPSSRHQ